MSERPTDTFTSRTPAKEPAKAAAQKHDKEPDRGGVPRELIAVVAFTGLVLVALAIALLARAGTSPAAPPPSASAPVAAAPLAAAPAAVPAPSASLPVTSAVPTPPAGGTRTYRVVAGDTLASVAARHGVDYRRIAADNQITEVNLIRPGDTLRIGPPTLGTTVIQPGDTLTGLAGETGLSIGQLRALNPWIADPDRIPAGAGLRVQA